jgi:hypothetical protein
MDSMNAPETLEVLAEDGAARGQMSSLAAARLRQFSPLLVRMGPVTLTLSCLALIGLVAMVYLGQVGAATAANAHLLALQQEHMLLVREDQALHERLGVAQSPAYIERRARELGLEPAPPGSIQVIVVPGEGGKP